MEIALNLVEQAINHWRIVHPAKGEERALSAEVNALAEVYALMIFQQRASTPLDAVAPQARRLLEEWLTREPKPEVAP